MCNRILHMFAWDIQSIINYLEEIKNSNWDSILIDSSQKHKEGDEWWCKYQIMDLDINNKNLLIELCQKAHNLGLNIYIDSIITHYANVDGFEKRFTPHKNVNNEIKSNKDYWKEQQDINYDDRYSITHHCNGLPSIQMNNYYYQDMVIKFYNELIDCGIDGIRIDSCKMIACPEEFNENNMFFVRLLNNLKKDIFLFGEVIHENEDILKMYQKYINVLTNISDEAYKTNKNKEVVFVESHDTFLNNNSLGYTKRLDNESILRNYKYLIKDFPNTIFYTRPFCDDWKFANL